MAESELAMKLLKERLGIRGKRKLELRQNNYLSSEIPTRLLPKTNITLFAQVIVQLPKGIIKSIIRKADTDKHCKGYNVSVQF